MVLAEGNSLSAACLRLHDARTAPPLAIVRSPSPAIASDDPEETLDLRTALEGLERRLIREALQRAQGNRTEAAALLGLNRTTLVEKLRKYA